MQTCNICFVCYSLAWRQFFMTKVVYTKQSEVVWMNMMRLLPQDVLWADSVLDFTINLVSYFYLLHLVCLVPVWLQQQRGSRGWAGGGSISRGEDPLQLSVGAWVSGDAVVSRRCWAATHTWSGPLQAAGRPHLNIHSLYLLVCFHQDVPTQSCCYSSRSYWIQLLCFAWKYSLLKKRKLRMLF